MHTKRNKIYGPTTRARSKTSEFKRDPQKWKEKANLNEMKECGNTKKPRKPKESMVSARHECILIPKR
jgi:hypothetical protein